MSACKDSGAWQGEDEGRRDLTPECTWPCLQNRRCVVAQGWPCPRLSISPLLLLAPSPAAPPPRHRRWPWYISPLDGHSNPSCKYWGWPTHLQHRLHRIAVGGALVYQSQRQRGYAGHLREGRDGDEAANAWHSFAQTGGTQSSRAQQEQAGPSHLHGQVCVHDHGGTTHGRPRRQTKQKSLSRPAGVTCLHGQVGVHHTGSTESSSLSVLENQLQYLKTSGAPAHLHGQVGVHHQRQQQLRHLILLPAHTKGQLEEVQCKPASLTARRSAAAAALPPPPSPCTHELVDRFREFGVRHKVSQSWVALMRSAGCSRAGPSCHSQTNDSKRTTKPQQGVGGIACPPCIAGLACRRTQCPGPEWRRSASGGRPC